MTQSIGHGEGVEEFRLKRKTTGYSRITRDQERKKKNEKTEEKKRTIPDQEKAFDGAHTRQKTSFDWQKLVCMKKENMDKWLEKGRRGLGRGINHE